jgi:hypothetical protein
MASRFEVIEEITTDNIATMTGTVDQQIKELHVIIAENSDR